MLHKLVNRIEDAFLRILKWATPKGILAKSQTHVCRVFHDSFKVTDADKVRMSIGILSVHNLDVDNNVGLTTIENGKHIVGHFVIDQKEFEKSWDSLFIWMNENGYKKSDRFHLKFIITITMSIPKKSVLLTCVFRLNK